MKLDLIIRRLGVTLALAIVLACIVAFINDDAALPLFLPSFLGSPTNAMWPACRNRWREFLLLRHGAEITTGSHWRTFYYMPYYQ
ncbi:MAG: hypothetical protein WBQ43_22160 [Terriglobales bacterium]